MGHNVLLYFDHMLKIQDLGFHVIKSLYTHPNRKLDWDVFLYVSDGKMEVWEEDQEYVVDKGQFLFLKSGLHHWGEPKTPAGTSWYWVHFSSDKHDMIYQELNMNLKSCQQHSISKEEYSKLIMLPKQGSAINPKMLEKKLDKMVSLFNSTDPFRAVTLSLQAMDLFLATFKETIGTSPLTKSDHTVQKIINYLERKNSYYTDSKELAACTMMNYSYLCEVFKMKTGNTIHAYNSQIFIDKAIRMMRDSSLNVSEISELLGFSNPFYFSRVFRKVTGYTPSEYMSRIYRDNI